MTVKVTTSWGKRLHSRARLTALVAATVTGVATVPTVSVATATLDPTSTTIRAAAPGAMDSAGVSGAESALRSIWPRFVTDLETDSPDMINVATPSAIKIIVGIFSCGCLFLSPTWTSEEMTAPASNSYPSEVLVELNNPHAIKLVKKKRVPAPFETFVILEKESVSTPWMIAFVTGNGNTAPTLAPTTAASMATTPQSSATFADTFSELVRAMTSARNTGRIPKDNMWDTVNTAIVPGNTMKDLEADYHSDVVTREHQIGGYALGPISQVFTVPQGTMECAYVEGTAIYSGQQFIQPKSRSIWGPLLPTGTYSSITLLSTRDACILREPSGHDVFIGMNGGVSYETGTPSS